MGTRVDEFASIASKAPRRSFLALVVVALALYLTFVVRDDLLYALSPSHIQDLGALRTIAAASADTLPVNRYVRLSGLPDRESAVILEARGSGKFTQFFRLLSTDNRILVSRTPDPLPVSQADRDVFIGRLVRFRDLSFADSIRQHFSARVSATHFLNPAELQRALAAGLASVTLVDLAGERTTVSPTDELLLARARPGELRITFPKARFADVAAATSLVESNGGQVVAVEPDAPDGHELFVTFAPEVRQQALSTLGDLDRRIRIRPAHTTIKAHLSDLSAAPPTGSGFAVKSQDGSTLTLPIDQVLSVRIGATVQIPEDALLLVEGDRPASHLKTLAIVAFLLAFAAVSLLSLRRGAPSV